MYNESNLTKWNVKEIVNNSECGFTTSETFLKCFKNDNESMKIISLVTTNELISILNCNFYLSQNCLFFGSEQVNVKDTFRLWILTWFLIGQNIEFP